MSADAFGAGGSDAQQTLQSFWPRVMEEIRNLTVVRYGYWNRHTHTHTSGFKHSHKQILKDNFDHALLPVPNTTAIHYFQKDFRVQELPLARIKKIMKLDEDVKVREQPK